MKLTCTQENLARGLHTVSRFSEKNTGLPILNNVLLKAQKDGLVLITTNLELGITTKIRAKIEEPGEFTVPARLLSEFVFTLHKENISLLLDEKTLTIKGENHQTTMRGLDAAEFPVLPDVDAQHSFTIATQEFKEALAQVIFAVSADESRPELCGVFMQFSAKNCVLAATDSYRLSEKKIAVTSANTDRNVIVPARTLQEVLRIIDNEESEQVQVRINDNQVLITIGETDIVSRIITGSYPDYKQIMPKAYANEIEFAVDDMVSAIKTTSLFCKQGINDVRLTLEKRFSDIAIQAENSVAGKNISHVPSQSKNQETDIVFNYKFFLDGLQRMAPETAILKTNDATSPALLVPKGEDGFQYIIMPIRQ